MRLLKRLARITLTPVVTALLLVGCGGSDNETTKKDEKKTSPAIAATSGSCVQADPTRSNITMCQETKGSPGDGSSICTYVGGKWSQTACDSSQYERRCASTHTESINDGPEYTVKQTDYFAKGSKMTCLGDETKITSK